MQEQANLFEVWSASRAFAQVYARFPDRTEELSEAYVKYLERQGWTALRLAEAVNEYQARALGIDPGIKA